MNETIENEEFREMENRSALERIDEKYIWNEISSVLNLEKGIFYTIKELFVRPGKTVRHSQGAAIQGKNHPGSWQNHNEPSWHPDKN